MTDKVKVWSLDPLLEDRINQLAGSDGSIEKREVDADQDGYLDCNPKTEAWSTETYGKLQAILFDKGLITKFRLKLSCGNKQNEDVIAALKQLLTPTGGENYDRPAVEALRILAEAGNQEAYETLIKFVAEGRGYIGDLVELAAQGRKEATQILVAKAREEKGSSLLYLLSIVKNNDEAWKAAHEMTFPTYTPWDIIHNLNEFEKLAAMQNQDAIKRLRSKEVAKSSFDSSQSYIAELKRHKIDKEEITRFLFIGADHLIRLAKAGNEFARGFLKRYINLNGIGSFDHKNPDFNRMVENRLDYLGSLALYALNKEAAHLVGGILQNKKAGPVFRNQASLFLLRATLAGNKQARQELVQLQPQEIAQFCRDEFEWRERYGEVPTPIRVELEAALKKLSEAGDAFAKNILSELTRKQGS